MFEKAKLFWDKSGKNEIVALRIDDDSDYNSLLRNCHNDGYRQVVITSEIMTQIIRHVYLDDNEIVQKIEFIEDDPELDYEITVLLHAIKNNLSRLDDLIHKLESLAEKSSIDLKRIYVKKPYSIGEKLICFFVQTNGIVGVNSESFDTVVKELSTLVKECLD